MTLQPGELRLLQRAAIAARLGHAYTHAHAFPVGMDHMDPSWSPMESHDRIAAGTCDRTMKRCTHSYVGLRAAAWDYAWASPRLRIYVRVPAPGSTGRDGSPGYRDSQAAHA